MSRFCVSPDPVSRRCWRPGHPFNPRCGRMRRIAMFVLLVLFSLIIFGYNYVTDSSRVRLMAETYLSRLIGGRVEVGSATLSIFEGLKLEGVNVYVDNGHKLDSLLFSAQTFVLKYDVSKIIRGQLEATQIIAEKPRVHLTVNAGDHEWNFYRLREGRGAPPPPVKTGPPPRPPPLPEVLLRNASVEVNEIRDGRLSKIGYEAMDGHLTPTSDPGSFCFDVQTRGVGGVGPWAAGKVSLGTGIVDAELHDFQFGRDLHAMLWENVRQFFEHRAITCRVESMHLHYEPEHDQEKSKVDLVLRVEDVSGTVTSEDWLSAVDVQRRKVLADGVVAMQGLYRLAGYRPDAAASAGMGGRADAEKGDAGAPVQLASIAPPPPDSMPGPALMRMPSARPLVPGSLPLASPADAVAAMTESLPIELKKGAGTFIFSESGVDVKDVTGQVEGNNIVINGHMTGYKPDAPFSVQIRSVVGDTLEIPGSPRYLNALPPDVREIYTAIRPDGRCTLLMNIQRPAAGSRPYFDGQVDIVDGVVASVFFPYPLSQTHGRVSFAYDPKLGGDMIHVSGVRGRGMLDGPNRDTWVQIDGVVGPLGIEFPDPQVELHFKVKGLTFEPRLLHALPPPVREPLKILDADQTGLFPKFHGDVSTTVFHHANWAWRWTFDTDLTVDDASVKLAGFPYLIEHLAGDIHVRETYVDIVGAHTTRGDASLRVDGRVAWGEVPPPGTPPVEPKLKTDIHVSARNLPLDNELLAAIPPDEAQWIKRLGVSGKLDVDGRVFQGLPDATRPGAPIDPNDVRFDLGMALHHGTLWPADGTFSVSNLSGRLHLTRDAMEIFEVRGQRGEADISADGALDWSNGPVQLAMHVNARHIAADSPLYSLLPSAARDSWNDVQPHGFLDADLTLRQTFHGEEKGDPARARTAPSQSTMAGGDKPHAPATAPAAMQGPPPTTCPIYPLPAAFSTMPPGLHAVLRPLGMCCTIKMLPYRLDNLRGTITITPEKVTVEDMTATHGGATITASGTGTPSDRSLWDLRLTAHDLPVDDEFHNSLPPTLVTVLDSIKLRGHIDVDIPKFIYRSGGVVSDSRAAPAPRGLASAPTASPADLVDIDMASQVTFKDCALDAGVPIQRMLGNMNLRVAVRGSRISAIEGDMALPKVMVAGRDMTDVNLHIRKPTDRLELYLEKVHGSLARGKVAGEAYFTYPDEGPSRYLLSLVVRNADLATLVQDSEKDVNGELTASLNLEGTWDGSAIRRGRGDVLVNGQELYHLPVLLGLFQVTSLSLPIATPFKTGVARYSVEGPRVNFERVELKSDNMLMRGDGYLDFKTRQVRMTLTTDNPGGLKVPFLNDLLAGARGELLKISIKGTIKEPKVEANPFGTFTTTIDEVFKTEPKKQK